MATHSARLQALRYSITVLTTQYLAYLPASTGTTQIKLLKPEPSAVRRQGLSHGRTHQRVNRLLEKVQRRPLKSQWLLTLARAQAALLCPEPDSWSRRRLGAAESDQTPTAAAIMLTSHPRSVSNS